MKKSQRPWEKEKRYPKELLEPIDSEKLWKRAIELATAAGDLTDNAVISRFEQLDTEEEERKLKLLLDYYDLEPTHPERWFGLAVMLARDHVPGMKRKERSKAGRSRRWMGPEGLKLVRAVLARVRASKSKGKQVSEAQALREAAEANPDWKKMSESSLRARYQEAKAYHSRGLSIVDRGLLASMSAKTKTTEVDYGRSPSASKLWPSRK